MLWVSTLSPCEVEPLAKVTHSQEFRGSIPESRKKGTIFDFAICYQDNRMQRYRIKDIGHTVSGKKSQDDSVTLKGSKFQIGDFMDIAIKEARTGGRDDYRDRNYRYGGDRRRNSYRPY